MKPFFKSIQTLKPAIFAGLLAGGVCLGAAAQGRVNYALGTAETDSSLVNRYKAVNWTRLGASQPTGLNINLNNGLYVGAWGTGMHVGRGQSRGAGFFSATETGPDIYAGYRSEISRNLWVDVGVQRLGVLNNVWAQVPGAPVVGQQSEVYGALIWGLFTAKIARNSHNLLGTLTPTASQYLDFSANFDLGNGYSLSPRLGRQDAAGIGALGFTDYSLTLGKTFANGLSLSVTALGTSAGQSLYLVPGSDFNSRLGIAAGLKYSF